MLNNCHTLLVRKKHYLLSTITLSFMVLMLLAPLRIHAGEKGCGETCTGNWECASKDCVNAKCTCADCPWTGDAENPVVDFFHFANGNAIEKKHRRLCSLDYLYWHGEQACTIQNTSASCTMNTSCYTEVRYQGNGYINLAPGEYEVQLASYDGHESDGYNDKQKYEQWYVSLRNASGNELAHSDSIKDLPNNSNMVQQTVNGTSDPIVINQTATRIYTLHKYHDQLTCDRDDYDAHTCSQSIQPVCAKFTKIDDEPDPATIKGKVYVDNNNNCSYDSGEPLAVNSSASVTLEQTAPTSCNYSSTQNTNNFSFNDLTCFDSSQSASYQLTAAYSDPNYQLTCGDTKNITLSSGDSKTRNFALTAPTPIPVAGRITGDGVYIDENENCSYDPGEPLANSTHLTLDLSQTHPPACIPNTYTTNQPLYSFNNLACFDYDSSNNVHYAKYTLTASYSDPQYWFRCDSSGMGTQQTSYTGIHVEEGSNVVLPAILLSQFQSAWLQVAGTGLHVNKDISVRLPETADTRYLVKSLPRMEVGPVTYGRNLDAPAANLISRKGWQDNYDHVRPEMAKYSYIKDKITKSGFDVTTTAIDLARPTTADTNGDGVITIHAQSAGTVNIANGSDWTNLPGSIVILAEGSVQFMGPVTLATDGFLMIVTKDDMTVDANVGIGHSVTDWYKNSTSFQLEGVFIAGRNFVVESVVGASTNPEPEAGKEDIRLNIKGSIVTGSNVGDPLEGYHYSSGGTYISTRQNTHNYEYPTDYIEFNPKLVLNAPRVISEPIYNWKETR